jgi:5-methylcytosine-specific restriction endonuclease McrA
VSDVIISPVVNELPIDGDKYIASGSIRLFQIRPCGNRHSKKLICKDCRNAKVLAKSNRSRNPIIPHLRDWILERDGNLCLKCGATEDLTVDHIVPVILGGLTNPDNLRTLCRACNSSKGSKLEDNS